MSTIIKRKILYFCHKLSTYSYTRVEDLYPQINYETPTIF